MALLSKLNAPFLATSLVSPKDCLAAYKKTFRCATLTKNRSALLHFKKPCGSRSALGATDGARRHKCDACCYLGRDDAPRCPSRSKAKVNCFLHASPHTKRCTGFYGGPGIGSRKYTRKGEIAGRSTKHGRYMAARRAVVRIVFRRNGHRKNGVPSMRVR